MPAVSKRKSSWAEAKAVWRLLWTLVFSLSSGSINAQESGLTLRPAQSLSVQPPASAAAREPDPTGPALGLTLSRELILVRPSVATPNSVAGEVLFQVDVNRQGLNETVMFIRLVDGRFLAAAEDLERWRIRPPSAVPLHYEGKIYYLIDDLPGATVQTDERRLTMQIITRPEAFDRTVDVVKPIEFPAAMLPHPGAFLNYHLSATQIHTDRTDNGLFEAGFFNKHGVLTSGLLAPELGSPRDWVRLDTTFNTDFPEKRTTLQLGDTTSRPGAWGRAVRLGGVQYGTNFTTQPGFIRTPVLEAAGSATLPSTVDVFVNNALARRTAVPPGPFSITNIPAITGAGDVRLVVTDLLGRQQVITTPYYGSIQLLKPGLTDYSYEAGLTRRGFAVESNEYGPPIAAATYRRGFTEGLTGELHGETSSGIRTVGPSAVMRVSDLGLLSTTYAVGHSDQGFGHLLGAGFERIGRALSFSAIGQWGTNHFRQVGSLADEPSRVRQTTVSVGYQLGLMGSVSATRVVQDLRGEPKAEVLTVAYNVPIGRIASFSLSAQRIPGPLGSTGMHASISIPFAELSTAALTVDRVRNNLTGELDNAQSLFVQKSPPLGDGYGYRATVRDQDFLGALTFQNSKGVYTAEANRTGDNHDASLRLGMEGGVTTIGGYTFATRNMTESFAVVHVADFPNVRILHDNQVVAKTDDEGYAVVPRLRAYDRNQIGIDQRDVPLDAVLGGLRLDATPYYRSGVLLEFPIKRVRAATMTITLDDGSVIPSGAVAHVEGKRDEFPVALRGELYIEGLETLNRVIVQWKGRLCTLEVRYPKSEDPLPDLGTFVCKGVER
jgi:outer membrane usher protein